MTAVRLAATSASARARTAGVFYLLDLATSVPGDLVLRGTPLGAFADWFATGCYVIVTVLLFSLLRVVNRTVALLMAGFSLLALTIWTFGHILWDGSASGIGNVVFGAYCLLAGYLIYRSTFMPRLVGAAMAFGGLGLITYLSPDLASGLYPYNAIPALVGEISLMLCLLIAGVNIRRWEAVTASC